MENKMRNFMVGRYGNDQLNVAMVVFGMILTFTGDAISSKLLTLLSYIVFGGCIYRVMSRDFTARSNENKKFLDFWNPISLKLKNNSYGTAMKDRNYKYFKCPNCKQMLRAPRGKGKIQVTCQKCRTQFIKKV
jgi:hypothetical protein